LTKKKRFQRSNPLLKLNTLQLIILLSTQASTMSGWFTFGTPTEEVDPETFSEAVGEEDFDPIVAIRSLEEYDYDSSFDYSNDVSPDSSVASQEEFYEDNGNVFGCLPSSSKKEGRKEPFVTYEVQPESFRSITAAATYPPILNIQISKQRNPTLYPIAGVIAATKTTSIQTSPRASVKRPNDTETNQSGAIEPPHTPTKRVVVRLEMMARGRKKPFVTYEVQPESFRSIAAAATYPPILNIQISEQRNPSLYPSAVVIAATKTTSIQKSSRALVTHSNDTETNQSGAIEPPHTPTTENIKKGSREAPRELNATVVAKETSLTSNPKEDREEARQLREEKLELMSNGREQPEERDLNTMEEAKLEYLTSIVNRISSTRRKHGLTSDGEEHPEEKESNTTGAAMKASSVFIVKELKEERQLEEKKVSLTSNDNKEKTVEEATNTSVEAMMAASASIVKDLQEEYQLKEINTSLASNEDRENSDEKGSNTMEAVIKTVASIVRDLREEELQLEEKKVTLTSNTGEKAEEKESKASVEEIKASIKALSTSIVDKRREEARQLNAKKHLWTSNTREKLEEKESNPIVEANKTPTSANTNSSLSPKATTKKGSKTTKDDLKAALDFYPIWKAEDDEQVNSPRENDEPVDQQREAPPKDVPKTGRPPRHVPRSHYLEPKMTESDTRKATRDPPSIKYLETSDSLLALSSLGSLETREDVNCVVEIGRIIMQGRTMDSNTILKDSSFASTTNSRKKVRFVELQYDFDNDGEMRDLEFNCEKVTRENLSFDTDDEDEDEDDVSVDSVSGDRTGCGCACGGELFSGLGELVQVR
jgi:hypothetical protein